MPSIRTIASSSAGNCVLISGKNIDVLVDCGVSAKSVEKALSEIEKDGKTIRAILITHEHIDHIKGLRAFQKKFGTEVYAHKETARILMEGNRTIHVKTFEENEVFAIEELTVKPFLTPHDTPVSVGFHLRFEDEQKTLGIATDFGCVTMEMQKALFGVDAVYMESNYDVEMLMSGRYPYFLKKRIAGEHGHLSNEDCSAFCEELFKGGTEKFLLGHLSAQNNLQELAFETTNQRLCRLRSKYLLQVAPQYCVSDAMVI